MRKVLGYYFYRGETIEKFGNGWMWVEEACRGHNTVPIYKALKDARNAINKYLDSTNDAEPRVIQTAGFEIGRGWYIK